MIIWNVTLDENDNAIMTPAPIQMHYEEEPLYLDSWIMDLRRDIEEEDERIQKLEEEWFRDDIYDTEDSDE